MIIIIPWAVQCSNEKNWQHKLHWSHVHTSNRIRLRRVLCRSHMLLLPTCSIPGTSISARVSCPGGTGGPVHGKGRGQGKGTKYSRDRRMGGSVFGHRCVARTEPLPVSDDVLVQRLPQPPRPASAPGVKHFKTTKSVQLKTPSPW